MDVEHGPKRWRAAFMFGPTSPRLVAYSECGVSLLRWRGAESLARSAGFLVPRGSLFLNEKWTI